MANNNKIRDLFSDGWNKRCKMINVNVVEVKL